MNDKIQDLCKVKYQALHLCQIFLCLIYKEQSDTLVDPHQWMLRYEKSGKLELGYWPIMFI